MKRSLILLVIFCAFNLWSTVGFVVNSGSETLSKIDFETGEIDNAFSVLGSMPNRVVLTQEFAYVVNSGDNNIQKINIQTGSTEALIFIGLSTNPYDIIVHENFAYVSGGLSNKIYQIDLDLDEVVNEVNVGGNPAGMAVYNEKLYVGNTDYSNFYAHCSVSIIELQSFTVSNTIPTEINPQFLKVINEKIHISCGGDWGSVGGKICILDPTLEEITNVIEIGGITYNLASTTNEIVYVSDGYGINLYAYDSADYSVIYNSSNPFTPGGIMVAANDENLFVLSGEWGENFTVNKFDLNENLIAEYEVALYAVDLKLMPEQTGITLNPVPNSNYHLTNFPNPFNPSTTIQFETASWHELLQIEIYNLKGQKLKTLQSHQITQSPNQQIIWNGLDQNNQMVSSGIYFYCLKINGKIVDSNKMVLMK